MRKLSSRTTEEGRFKLGLGELKVPCPTSTVNTSFSLCIFSTKLGTSRMAAAIDAMAQFGFPKKLVRAKMNYLLKEYGGDVGYSFIEGDAYKVLIDALLSGEKEECNLGQTSMKDDSSEGERVGDHTLLATAGPSGGSIGSRDSETLSTELQTDRAEEDGNRRKEICSQDERIVEATDNTGGSPVGDVHLHNPPVCSPPVVIVPPPASQLIPTRRRKPCYGWISDDDDEECDVVVLPASAPTPARQAKRKTRWNSRSEDK